MELLNPELMPKLIGLLSSLLERVAESNDMNRRFQPQKTSVFDGPARPTVSIRSYLERIVKYANCSPFCLVVAYVYLDRYTQRQPTLPITSLNVHRLLITTVMLAAKFMGDLCYDNAHYAKVGGLTTREMNLLEVEFLFQLQFHLNVTLGTFCNYSSYLHRQILLQHPPALSLPESPSNMGGTKDESSHQQTHPLAV